MARPKPALISRRKVLVAALAIIDAGGLDALSIRRLGLELGVHGSSLYHHFADKDAIVVGAAELALQDVRTPEAPDEAWPVWVMRNNHRTREALLSHPHLIPAVLEHAPLGIGTTMRESSAALLVKQGMPVEFVLPLLETLEMIAISSAMYTHRIDGFRATELSRHDYPTLRKAARSRDRNERQLFELACAAVIASCEERIAHSRPRAPRASRRERVG
jgi:AcrR family transcriptional regulator